MAWVYHLPSAALQDMDSGVTEGFEASDFTVGIGAADPSGMQVVHTGELCYQAAVRRGTEIGGLSRTDAFT
jgi:hypothetical protein